VQDRDIAFSDWCTSNARTSWNAAQTY